MAGHRQFLLYWDPELEGAFRRRLERAFGDLNLNASDAAAVDPDPDAPPPVRLALVSISGSAAHSEATSSSRPARATSTNPPMPSASKPGTSKTRRAARPSSSLAPEDLEVKLDHAARRADEAERALPDMERKRSDALHAAKHAETSLAAERSRTTDLQTRSRAASGPERVVGLPALFRSYESPRRSRPGARPCLAVAARCRPRR